MWKSLAAAALIGSGVLLAAPAQATDGLQWQWDAGTSRTYHLQSQIRLSRVVFLNAFNNIDTRITQVHIEMVTTCTDAQPMGKKAWELACTIDDFTIRAAAIPQDKGRLDPVLQEWDERLTGVILDVQLTEDGRVRNVGYRDITRRNRRDGMNLERVRQLLLRQFSALDLRLPKKGDDKDVGAWSAKGTTLAGFPSTRGSVGAVEVTHQITGAKGDLVKIASTGNGTVGNVDTATEVAGNEEYDYYRMDILSETTWDRAHGTIVKRQVAVTAEPTASAQSNDGTPGLPYVQMHAVTLLREGQPAPLLPDNAEVDSVFEASE